MTTASSDVYVVTGCTQGLGYFCVKTLAANPSVQTVVLACRNVENARKAADEIANATKTSREKLVVLDEALNLSDTDSVRAYAAALRRFLGDRKILSLVNNAGIGGSQQLRKSKQGYEEIWATNHLGHFLLTVLVLKYMAENSRIVNVASEVHDPDAKTGMPDPGGANWPEAVADYDKYMAEGAPLDNENASTSGSRRYTRSKLCNVLFTYELARRLTGAIPHGVDADVAAASRAAPNNRCCRLSAAPTIQVVAMNPGLMLDTGFATGVAGSVVGWIAYLLSPILRLTPLGRLMRSGPQSGVDLATISMPAAAGETTGVSVTGLYYDGAEVKPSSVFSRDKETVARRQGELWAHSVRWARVSPEELADAGL